MYRIVCVSVILLAAALALIPADADGCAAVRRSDRPEDYVRIAEESAIIVWDPVKKIEHFIRTASFDTKSPDFGFLVPTPSVPTLKEVESFIFRLTDDWIKPRVVDQSRMHFEPLSCLCCPMMFLGGSKPATMKDGVRLLHEQKVGGYDAAVLEADNTQDLAEWLKKNKYSDDPELQSWLVPYVGAKWKITAFKISQNSETGKLATTKPVRMSFASDRPFFPYREPESKPKTEAEKKAAQEEFDKAAREGKPRQFHINEKGEWIWNDARTLRVHFVSASRMEAKLGPAAWHASVKFADQLNDEQRKQIAKETGIAENELPAQTWLTTFEDRAEPRPGKEEVYFEPAAERTPIRPPDIIRYNDVWIPIDVLVMPVLLVIAVLLWHRWRKRAAIAPPEHS